MNEGAHKAMAPGAKVAPLKVLRNSGGVTSREGDDEDDGMQHTILTFRRLGAVRALNAAYREWVRRTWHRQLECSHMLPSSRSGARGNEVSC